MKTTLSHKRTRSTAVADKTNAVGSSVHRSSSPSQSRHRRSVRREIQTDSGALPSYAVNHNISSNDNDDEVGNAMSSLNDIARFRMAVESQQSTLRHGITGLTDLQKEILSLVGTTNNNSNSAGKNNSNSNDASMEEVENSVSNEKINSGKLIASTQAFIERRLKQRTADICQTTSPLQPLYPPPSSSPRPHPSSSPPAITPIRSGFFSKILKPSKIDNNCKEDENRYSSPSPPLHRRRSKVLNLSPPSEDKQLLNDLSEDLRRLQREMDRVRSEAEVIKARVNDKRRTSQVLQGYLTQGSADWKSRFSLIGATFGISPRLLKWLLCIFMFLLVWLLATIINYYIALTDMISHDMHKRKI